MCITGPIVLYRLWQWEDVTCQTELLVESAFCQNCKVIYDVKNEPYARVTYRNGCPLDTDSDCWYNHSDNSQVTFEHPIYEQSWASWQAFRICGIMFAVITCLFIVMFCIEMKNDVSYDFCNMDTCYIISQILAGISAICFIVGIGFWIMVGIDKIKWQEYDVCKVQFNFTNEGCETCYVQTPERHIYLDSCPEQDWKCWAKKDNSDDVTFNDPAKVQNFNDRLTALWLTGLGIPGMIYGCVLGWCVLVG